MSEASGVFALVVRREIGERLRSGGFWVSTWLSVAAVVLVLAAPSLRGHDDGPQHLASVGALDPGTARQLLALVIPPDSLDVATMPALADEAEARAALRDHRIDVAVVGTERIVTLEPVDPGANDRTTRLVIAVERVLATNDALQAAGLNPATITRIQGAQDRVTVEAVTSSTAVVDRSSRRTTAAVGTALTVLFAIVYGSWILDGVLEEKASRVVELLLTTVHPGQLLRGKVVGTGAVALLQSALLTATALGAAGLFSSGAALRDDKLLVLAILAWFLLGYCAYGAAFGLVGAVSRRHAEAQGASFLVLAPLLAAAGVASPVLTGQRPDGLLRVLSVVPLTAPVAMPVRQAVERVATAQVLVAGLGLVVTAALLLALGTLGYRRSVLEPTRPLLSRRPPVRAPATTGPPPGTDAPHPS